MPKIARILPTGNKLTTESPNNPLRQPAGSGQAIISVGQNLSQLGGMLKQAGLVAEKTKAQNHLETRLDELHRMATNETDLSPDRMRFYDEEIDKAHNDATQNISIPEERSIFSLESKSKSDISKNYVNSVFLKKTIDQGKADLDIYLSNKKNSFIQAPNASEKNLAITERNMKIKEMAEGGFLAPAEATTLVHNLDKEWNRDQVEYDIATNPEMAKQLLEQKFYKDIDEQERVKLIKDADAIIATNQRIAAQKVVFQQEAVKDELLTKLFDKQLTINDIISSKSALNPEDAISLRKALLSPKPVDPVMANLKFDEFQKRFNAFEISDNNKTDASYQELFDFRSDILKAVADGEIEEADGRRLYRETSLAYNIKQDSQSVIEVKKENGWFKNFTNAITFWADENAPKAEEAKARLQREFVERVTNGEEGPAVYTEIMEREKDQLSPERKNYKLNDVVTNSYGVSFKVIGEFPDGSPKLERLK